MNTGGLNLNSPIVQSMLANTPPGTGNMLPTYYGNSPSVETVTSPSPPSLAPSPFQMINGVGMQNYQLPSYQFNGALSGQVSAMPSYFDVNQPIGKMPNQMNHMGIAAPMPAPWFNSYQPMSQFIAPPPTWIHGYPSGTLYSNVEGFMTPGIQENHFNPLPSSEAIQRYNQPVTLPMQGYYNPYFGTPINRVDPYVAARNNYAIEFGYKNAEEMAKNDLEVKKMLSRVSCKQRGMSDEETEEFMHQKYVVQPEEVNKMMAQPINPYSKPRIPSSTVRIMRGDELIKSVETNPGYFIPNMANELIAGADYAIRNREARRFFNMQKHNSAMERQFDTYGILDYFNNAFYELHYRDMKQEAVAQKNSMVGKIYDQDSFKRSVMARAGRHGVKMRIHEEDLNNGKSDKNPPPSPIMDAGLPSNVNPLLGQFNMPKPTPMNVEVRFNPMTGRVEQAPVTKGDDYIEQRRAYFRNSIGGR